MSNIFAGFYIDIPEEYKEYFHKYCLTRYDSGSRNNPEDSPFPRMVDMWFLALCIAVKEGLSPQKLKGKTYKAIEGNVFGSDTWRSNALILLAIADKGDIEIINEPGQIIRLANEYAMAGLPRLISLLEECNGDTAIDYLSDEIESLINEYT